MIQRARTLLHVFSTFAVGGPQMRFVQLANHFGRKYRHRIIAMDGATAAFARLTTDLDAILLGVSNNRGRPWMNIRAFRNVLRDVQPDLLVTSNWGSIEWAVANHFCGVPQVHVEDGFGPEEAQTQFARRVWARRLVLRRTTVVLPSQTLLSIARDRWHLPSERTVYIPNGVDCERFQAMPDPDLLAKCGIANEVPVIGTVTTLRPEKNLHRLIDAFSEVRGKHPAQLVIVGDGPQRASLQSYCIERGVARDVVFAGPCATPEKLLRAFRVFVISSDTEQMPFSVLEAMAAGLPVAATSVGDIPHMLSEENHPYLVDRDAGRLATAISILLSDPHCAAIIGAANARRAASKFSQDRMFADYGALFDGKAPPSGRTSNPTT